ncbi:deoxyribonucleoside-triphosphatase [Niabella soli DSM 19437]|uniref:dITP/XTP pyrophosphatase n=1 Tax=Niabella soli DSM 19437 TaxID=929713 RepID=W0F1H8_9BACT|nr:deoxyribonucleoside-triphosphatase [Niabella soli DSM 19437]
MTLIFATNNENKVREIRQALPEAFEIISLKEAGILKDIPEPFDTLEENATEKSTVIHKMTGKNCFSEDSGLMVTALDGAPGVKSARFADGEPEYASNTDKLLHLLKDTQQRTAHFKTVISLIINAKELQFEGICTGRIATEAQGTNGFGYDPVFIPDGSDKTFGQMSLEEKQEFSHRKKAVKKLVVYLKESMQVDRLTS